VIRSGTLSFFCISFLRPQSAKTKYSKMESTLPPQAKGHLRWLPHHSYDWSSNTMSKLSVTINDATYDVELDQQQRPDADLTVVVDGETLHVIVPELTSLDATGWLLIDGRPYEVTVDRNLHWIKSSRGVNRLELRDRETATARPASADGRVKAPIPGQIARLLVALGDTVEVGQSLMILEAMKMENHVRAPRAGKVDQLTVAAGQTVTLHALLAEIV
jgi:biotin carboxyl carrier protein